MIKRYAYLVYYEAGPTPSAPNRLTKSEQEVIEALRALPEHLEHYFDAKTTIEAFDIETDDDRGLLREVAIITSREEASVDSHLVHGLKGLDLCGNKLS
ncbi:hypothetical protein AB1286_07760 [Trinickia sp. NRRL B-1857]|uniref:hypothetical protein n=1 Tax=Trinickia sp. NRRL B-1857 TaxID=3162879 RepID=UPI003D26EBE8